MKQITQNLRWLITLLAMIVSVGAWADDIYTLHTGAIEEGDYIICYENHAMKAEVITGNKPKLASLDDVAITDNKITDPDASIIWHIARVPNTENWTIYNNAAGYAASTGANEQATLSSSNTDNKSHWIFTYELVNYTGNTELVIKNLNLLGNNIYKNYCYLRFKDNFYCYLNSSATNGPLSLYKKLTVATPTFSPEGGEFTRPFDLTISCATEGATIYYTTDVNGTPTTQYTGAIRISSSKTVKAIAIKDGVSSEEVTAEYKINPITTIPDVETLVAFRETVNGGVNYTGVEVKLTADLDMSTITTDIDPSSNASNTWTASIGTEDNPFRGTFNGQGHTISNLKCYHSDTQGPSFELYSLNGLFGYVTGGTIKDVTLTGVDLLNAGTHTDMTSDATEVYTYGFGGLVGLATDATIENCDLSGLVQYGNSNNVGAIVGLLTGNSSVSGCDVNIETLNGHRATGGVVGGVQVASGKTVIITDCSTENSVGGNACTGGVVGYVYSAADGSATISSCFNSATIGGNGDYCGGIVGYADIDGVTDQTSGNSDCSAIKIESCYNTGSVGAPSYSYIGGIIGYSEATLTNCYNQGKVIGLNLAGGIIGMSAAPYYSYVYNSGSLTGNSRGGIIGAGWGSRSGHCYYQNTASYGVYGGAVTPAGNSYASQVSDEMMNFTQLSPSDMQGWKLSSDASDKLGDNKDLGAGTGNDRKWIFVRANLPILTGVRGQSVKIPAATGKHKTDDPNSTYTYAYASFYSDMTFKCGTSFTGVYESKDTKSEFKVKFVEVPQGIMYGGVDSNGKKKGYTLFQNYNSSNSSFILEYLPNVDAKSSAAMSLKNGNIFYGTHSYTTSEEMKVSDGRLYSLSVIEDVAAYRQYVGKYLGGNKSYIIYNYEDAAQSTGSGQSSSPTENQVKPAAIFLSNLFVEPEAVLLGDVDVDGAVTVSDVVKMVNVVLNESADDVIMKHGDVNGDGDLDVADVVAIVNKVLGVENDVKSRKVNSVANGGDEASLELNDGVVDFLLSNSSAFCAFQFYMSAEDGLDCEKIILSARAKGHTVSMNKLTDGRYKVMCYSGVNKSFEGSEGELFNILTSGASGKLTLEDLFFVTPGASKVKFGNMDIDVVATGISSIDADANGNANTIFDLSGRRVQKVQKGVYIVNGKKVIL